MLWLERFGAPGSQDYLTGAAADGSGGVIATGETWGRLGGANAGRSDVWIARYDGAGQESWATQFGSAREDRPCDVSPDGLGGFYLCGRTRGALGTPPAGIVDPWVARIDGAGGIVWLRQFGSGSGDSAIGIAADSRGDVFVAGQTSGALGGSHAGSSDIWFARIDGNLITTRECHPAVANSTGLAGRIDGSGSNFVAASELRLSASGLPPHVMTVFLTSRTRDLVSGPGGSDGVLCLGGAVGRYVGAGQVQSSGSTGSAQLEIDLTQTPTPTGLVDVLAGDTWFFQAWYRDVGASSNFTDSLSIAFR
ncbi:MAG: SBBP repeat-containing protein [Planctomycetota bacterium]